MMVHVCNFCECPIENNKGIQSPAFPQVKICFECVKQGGTILKKDTVQDQVAQEYFIDEADYE